MRFLPIVVIVLLSSGCVGASVVPAETGPVAAAAVGGLVLDVEHRPVEGANVVAGDRVATTGPDGRYAHDALAPGRITLRVSHDAYEPLSVDVVLQPGVRETRDLVLVPLPVAATFNETFPFRGRFDCGWDFVILGGDCMVLYRNLTGADDPVTKEQNAFRLPVRPGWYRIQLNVSWKTAAENQLEGMRLYLEHGNGSAHGHATSVAQTDGPVSPLELVLERGKVHPAAEYYEGTKTRATLSDAGEELQVRVLPRGRLSSELGSVCHEGRCFLGVGFGLELDFDVSARVSYRT